MAIPPVETIDDGISNQHRARWAEIALISFGLTTGMVRSQMGDQEEPSLVLADLLADLAHWCDRNNVEFEAALDYAAFHYRAETASQGKQLPVTHHHAS